MEREGELSQSSVGMLFTIISLPISFKLHHDLLQLRKVHLRVHASHRLRQ